MSEEAPKVETTGDAAAPAVQGDAAVASGGAVAAPVVAEAPVSSAPSDAPVSAAPASVAPASEAVAVSVPAPAETASASAPVSAVVAAAAPSDDKSAFAALVAAQTGPSEQDIDFLNAKSYLLQTTNANGVSIYEHLSNVVMRLIEEHPENPLDDYEAYSAEVKRATFKPALANLSTDVPAVSQDVDKENESVAVAKLQAKLFDHEDDKAAANDGESEVSIPDIMLISNFIEWAGFTIGREETFRLLLSIKKLVASKPFIRSVRFFGKILGTKRDYFILETEIKEGETVPEEDRAAEFGKPAAGSEETKPEDGANGAASADGASGKADESKAGEEAAAAAEGLENLPKPKIKVPGPLPAEAAGTGVNRYTFYVCNSIGGTWTALRDVTPEQLQASRKIRKYFTGDLSTNIVSYPPFPGNEAVFLRCQIARITSGTVICPAGYYTMDGDEAEEEADAGKAALIVNPEYEPQANDKLLDLSNWVHYVAYVLPQGRTTWAPYPKPPAEKAENDEEAENEDDDADAEDESQQKEEGKALLSILAEDEEHNGIPPWSARLASPLSPSKYTPVFLRSNRWPGAVAIAYNDMFHNVYIGTGLKDLGNGARYAPPALPQVQLEFGQGTGEEKEAEIASITEDHDPTLEEENELKKKNEEAEEKPESEAGGDEDGSGAEEGDEERK